MTGIDAAVAAYREALAPCADMPWGTGRRKPRNLYVRDGDPDTDIGIGQLDTPELAQRAVDDHNAMLTGRETANAYLERERDDALRRLTKAESDRDRYYSIARYAIETDRGVYGSSQQAIDRRAVVNGWRRQLGMNEL